MTTPELVGAVMQERMREAAELRRQQEARDLQEQGATPRGGLSLERIRRLLLPSFMTRGFRTASIS